jgi:hypothetical protein
MKLAIVALLAGSAAAFAPQPIGRVSTVVMASPYADEFGVIDPTGFFDPLGLSDNIDQEKFDFYRAAEIKNGRAAMLAVVGYVFQENFRFPGYISPGLKFTDVPNGIAAINTIPALGWIQIFFLIGAVDYYGFLGDFEFGKLNLAPAELEKRQLNELQNGRLAMLAFAELIRHDSQNLVKPGFDGLDHLITGLPFLYE